MNNSILLERKYNFTKNDSNSGNISLHLSRLKWKVWWDWQSLKVKVVLLHADKQGLKRFRYFYRRKCKTLKLTLHERELNIQSSEKTHICSRYYRVLLWKIKFRLTPLHTLWTRVTQNKHCCVIFNISFVVNSHFLSQTSKAIVCVLILLCQQTSELSKEVSHALGH